VVNVAGATGFLRVVAGLGILLVAVEGLDGDVDVENARRSAPSYTAKRTPQASCRRGISGLFFPHPKGEPESGSQELP
jgi:hypothetical protein